MSSCTAKSEDNNTAANGKTDREYEEANDNADISQDTDTSTDTDTTEGTVLEDENIISLLTAEFIADRCCEQLSEYKYFDDAPGDEYAVKVLFTATAPLTDVCYLDLTGNEGKVLYSFGELDSDKIFVINMVIEGIEPNRAIAYNDINGDTYVFAITESGEDYVPILMYKSDVKITKIDFFQWPDVAEIVNLQGDETTVYQLEGGKYMDRIERVFTYDGNGTWTDEDGAEWNLKAN